jgi:hypothetical protein
MAGPSSASSYWLPTSRCRRTTDGRTEWAEARVISVQTLAGQWNAGLHILTLSVEVAVTVSSRHGRDNVTDGMPWPGSAFLLVVVSNIPYVPSSIRSVASYARKVESGFALVDR